MRAKIGAQVMRRDGMIRSTPNSAMESAEHFRLELASLCGRS